MPKSPLLPSATGVCVLIRLTPRARQDRLVAVVPAAGGGLAVKAAVTAPAQGGQANAALLRLLAREWRLPPRALAIVAGAASRDKRVEIAGEPRQLTARIEALIAALPVLPGR